MRSVKAVHYTLAIEARQHPDPYDAVSNAVLYTGQGVLDPNDFTEAKRTVQTS